jgi:serine protease AprX
MGAVVAAPAVPEPARPTSQFLGGKQWEAAKDLGSMFRTAQAVGAKDVWKVKYRGQLLTGQGVGVALVDTGVTRVPGLDEPGKVIDGPDLSVDGQDEAARHLDGFGHGTHLAGIIAARDVAVKPGHEGDDKNFVGIAPDAHVVNVKVADSDGATDVSQVIAGIDWVVAHKDDPGLNVRVLELAYGTSSTQSYLADPLAFAVENAWRHGIVVVVAAGNDGVAGVPLTDPAIDPYVIAVGASDNVGTDKVDDDQVADFTSVGTPARRPDLLAPGRSIVSLRDPGSVVDVENPDATVANSESQRFLRGTGTSQASAVVAGAVALLLQERPDLTPDQVKALLLATANPLKKSDSPVQGAGQLDIKQAVRAKDGSVADAVQTWPAATGLGSIEAARGGAHLVDPATGQELSGEIDVFGRPWDAARWAADTAAGRAWVDGAWEGEATSGGTGDSSDWDGRTWHGRTWHVDDWHGRTWHGRTWHDAGWRSGTWQ